MKITSIFVLSTLSFIVEGAWYGLASRLLEPFIMSVGTAFVALKDVNFNDFVMRNDGEFDEGGYRNWFRNKFGIYPDDVREFKRA